MDKDYSLVTNFLQTPSYLVLVDWLDFLPYPPRALLCFCGGNEETEKLARDLCRARGIEFVLPPADLTEDIRKSDLPVIRWQFENTRTTWCMRVALDTIPYRSDNFDWLSHAIARMQAEDMLFLTGSTKPFRADRPSGEAGFLLSRRVSLNFILIRPRDWLRIFDDFVSARGEFRRFYTEGSVEHHCADNDVWGLRLENLEARRIFHVQEWGQRIAKVRDAFRAGRGIGPFMTGYADDENRGRPWERYFMYPKDPLVKRLRVGFGAWRRSLFSGG